MPTAPKKNAKKDSEKKPAPVRSVASAKSVTVPKTKSVEKYFQGIGRRKQAVAGAKLYISPNSSAGKKEELEILINGKSHKNYFSLSELREIVTAPLEAVSSPEISRITVAVRGGGIRGQAEATRLGIARALIMINQEFRKPLRDLGLLTRDARVVERKKAGLKKARRAPQFSKR